MAVTDNVSSMIDYLVLRHRLNAASDRAELLSYLQATLESVWSMRAWWFQQVEDQILTTMGQSEYTVNTPCKNVLELSGEDGTPLEFILPDVFARLFRPFVAAVGTPISWTMMVRETQDTCKVQVYPSPDDAFNLTAIKETTFNVLADSTNSEVNLPDEYRIVVLTGAEQRLMRAAGQVEASVEKDREFQQLLKAMQDEDDRQPKVTR